MKIGLALTSILITLPVAAFLLTRNLPATNSFDYHLEINPTAATVQQGSSLLANITITYLQGTPETVTLTASGGPDGTTCSFSNQTGTPTSGNVFNSSLTINVPASAPTNNYTLNITSAAENGKTHPASCTLLVLNATIQVSGVVAVKTNDPIYPTQIQFINTATNLTYTAIVVTTPSSPSAAKLIQQGTYSLSLPNQQSYHVIYTWTRLFGPWFSPSDAPSGTFDGGTLHANCPAGVTSITQDYSG